MTLSRTTWLVPLFLVFGVLAPAGCVLWFMNAAVVSQTAAARQSVNEAYRSNLQLLRDRADSFWRDRAAAIEGASSGGGPVAFQRIVTQGLADSVILPHYPALASTRPSDLFPPPPQGDWAVAAQLERDNGKLALAAAAYAKLANTERDPSLAARAAQARIRCLLRSGDKTAALNAIAMYFDHGRLRSGHDSSGRLIAADETLLAVHLKAPSDKLESLLNDYSGPAMPSAQRLFLMDELGKEFPTSDAERTALQFLESGAVKSAEPALDKTRVAGIWSLPAASGKITAIYRTASIQKATEDFLRKSSTLHNISFTVSPPGTAARPDAVPAGPELPGWTFSFDLRDPALVLNDVNDVRARTASYLWIGYLMLAFLAITGVVVTQWLRREARLARLKTDLVAAVSHELRTPLSSIRLLVETLLDDAEAKPAKIREYLKLIDGENLRLAKLIENFLTFSRLERRKQQFDFAPTLVSTLVERGVAAMGDRLHPPACELEIEMSAGGATIMADEDALVRVLVNLLDNACKYSIEPRHVRIAAEQANGVITLSVQDNGIGVAPRDQRRIFRRFYQVDQRLARETGGCGLGLSIVESLVRAHRGEVRVASKPGSGSTFTVRIPVNGPHGMGKAA